MEDDKVMKKAFNIESHRTYSEDGKVVNYVPISQNGKWLYELLARCSLECIGMKQYSNTEWKIRLKGRKKNIQKFVAIFTIGASSAYRLNETVWW